MSAEKASQIESRPSEKLLDSSTHAMSRRGSGTAHAVAGGGLEPEPTTPISSRERPNSTAGAVSRSRDGSPSSHDSASSRDSPGGASASTVSAALFVPIRSRVGKRFQAALPELREKPVLAESDRAHKMLKVMHLSKARYSLDRANALGADLEKYLKMARSLRDGSTFDTDEQITCLALQYLHRFDYNTTDAACSLYARHSMEVPKLAASTIESSATTRTNNPAEIEAQWLLAFYRAMRAPRIGMDEYREMAQLLAKAATSGIAATELGVLERLVNRLTKWLTAYEDVKEREVDRVELEQLVYQAEDLMFETAEKNTLEQRLREFDIAYGRLKDAVERNNRRNQSKSQLDELEELFAAVLNVQVNFPEKTEFTAMLEEASQLKRTIMSMLVEEKVSLTAMREVIARIELVPVNFEKEVDQFQQKMLNAQSWLAKVRKCIPKRRTSRRGGPEPKKMDLQAIRALVDDAPCEDSAEMFEMQDLLECADEWAEKVKRAIEGGADVSLAELKELMEEGNAMPVNMDEQNFLEAEISAREWCTEAATMLAAKKPFGDLEDMAESAKEIRKHLHPKKQSRWKPQIERDIHSALDTARRWINEIRDVLGHSAFDKLIVSGSSVLTALAGSESATSSESTANSSNRSEATGAFIKGKKSVEAVHKLLEKADKLVVNVESYTTRLQEVISLTAQVQQEALDVLVKIGVKERTQEQPPAAVDDQAAVNGEDAPMPLAPVEAQPTPKNIGEFSHACSVLDRIAGLPLIFDEGVELFEVVHAEKGWAERVRDAIPPRQSRKKRMAKHETTLEDLRNLQEESRQLRFQFPEEVRILSRELEDIAVWQQKAIEVVASRATTIVDQVAMPLKKHDMLVFARFTEAKSKLVTGESGNQSQPPPTTSEVGESVVKLEERATGQTGQGDGDSSYTSEDVKIGNASVPDQKPANEVEAPMTPVGKAAPSGAPAFVAEPFQVENILNTIRREAGCAKRNAEENSEEKEEEDHHKKSARGFTVLDPLLTLVEESIAAVNAVEAKDEKKKLDELLLSSTPQEHVFTADSSPEKAVKQLELWHDQISQLVDEGSLFNAVAPEQEGLSLVVELLEWLQNARSIFYNEPLPLKELVEKGTRLEQRIDTMRAEFVTFDDATMDLLASLLWPLPYLVMHDRVVQTWVVRVNKCLEDKHAPIDDVQKLLGEAYSLLLEPDAFKLILDELKKAKLWLAKLKKRLKSLMTKQVSRLTMAIAKSLVEEGEEIAIELPAFDMLKEHVELASDWEKRVLASGLESGQARIAHLLSLIEEYDRARLVIDLDMHRDVLKSATERYCVCRQPYDGFMIGCDFCDDWFHDNCIGMSKEKAEKVENYTCPSCTILQELKGALLRAVEGQSKLWADTDYGKGYEKQHAATQRKIKREEKAIERSEMLLFSCNNHMNQLRARIEDIERAKSCFTTLKNPFEAATSAQQPSNGVAAAAGTPGASATPSGTPQATAGGSTAAKTPTSLAVTLPLKPPTGVSTPSQSSATAIPNVPIDTLAFVQRYPNILLPSAKFGLAQGEAARQQAAASASEASSTVSTPTTAAPQPAEGQPSPASAPPVAATATAAPAPAPTSAPVSAPVPAASATPATLPTGMTEMMPNMLAPMLAKLSENTERLSALLVAGGVEQQLTKMKSEHAEVKAQVNELQEMIRLSKERMAAAQSSLDDLKRSYVIRQHGLPRAKTWIQRVIRLMNSPTSLLRSKFASTSSAPDDLCFLSAEFSEALMDAKAKEIDHFSEVMVYSQLLRAVGWSLVAVSLLQERPSREALMVAIVYANEHHIIDPAKAVAPLRSIIGRVDVWITKANKTLGKQSSPAQKLTRLKALMNEYSKLPLTCSWVQTLEAYVQALEHPDDTLTAEESIRAQTDLEAKAVAAIFSASTTWLPAPNPKIPRKRKPYTKRDKGEAVGGDDGDDGDAGGEPGTPEPKKSAAKKAKTSKAAMKAAAALAAQPEQEHEPSPRAETADDVEMKEAPESST